MYHLEYSERRSIERYLNQNSSIGHIAKQLKRSKSTISTEITLGKVKGIYKADKAQKKSEQRRKASKQKCLKVAMTPVLKSFVTQEISAHQSPESISGRLKNVLIHLPYASTKAIYNFLDSSHGGPLKHHLYQTRVKGKGGPKRGSVSASDQTKKSIIDRPKAVNKRLEFGHFEGDFIESGKGGTGSILVLVERKTRYPFLIYTEDKTTLTINHLIATVLKDVPVRSLTLDNDISFQKHEALSALIEATVYFTRPYTSSDKGTVENRNGRIREFVPKRCDISAYRDMITEAQQHLRTRYLKCLGFYTPEEVWERELLKATCVKIKKTAVMAGRNY
jgi:IS30 family transposase